MRNGFCSKCSRPTVHAARGGVSVGSDGWTELWPHMDKGVRGLRVAHRTRGLWAFACVSCGYLELHLADPEDLGFVHAKWPRVPPTGTPGANG